MSLGSVQRKWAIDLLNHLRMTHFDQHMPESVNQVLLIELIRSIAEGKIYKGSSVYFAFAQQLPDEYVEIVRALADCGVLIEGCDLKFNGPSVGREGR